MVHHTSLVLRVIGLLIALSGLSFVLYQAFREAEWLREVKTAMQPTHQKKPWVGRYILRIQEAKKWMGKEDEPMYRTILRVIALAMGLMVMLLLLRYSILIAFLIGIGGALLITDRYYVTKGNQAKERHLKVFLEEAVPVGIHVITASGELAPAFSRMASTVTYPPLKTRLQRLADTWKLPQFATAEDAFLHFAHDMGLLELTIFALCTKEVRAYRVPLEELWMEMSELLGLEIHYRERLRAETAQFRTGGYLFYGVLAGSLLVAYPFTKSYMSGTVQVVFWLVLGIMTVGLQLVIRRSQVIDV